MGRAGRGGPPRAAAVLSQVGLAPAGADGSGGKSSSSTGEREIRDLEARLAERERQKLSLQIKANETELEEITSSIT